MTTQTVTLPAISPQLQQAIRTLGCQIGWKNCAKQLAYGPVRQEPTCVPMYNDYAAQRKKLPPAYARAAKLPKGLKRNAAGGLACPKPGGMAREWGDLMGVGIGKAPSRGAHKPGRAPASHNWMVDKENSLPRHPAEPTA